LSFSVTHQSCHGIQNYSGSKHDDKGKALGCIKEVAKNNPHCDGDGIPSSSCNTDGNEEITAQELVDETGVSLTQAQADILFAEGGTGDGIINTESEFTLLKTTSPYNTLC